MMRGARRSSSGLRLGIDPEVTCKVIPRGRTKWTTSPFVYSIGMALVFLGLNYPFIGALIDSAGGLTRTSARDAFTLLFALYALLFLLFILTAWKWVTKPFGYFLLLSAAPAAGAIAHYGTEFSPLMIRSVFSTDLVEATGFFSIRFVIEYLLLAVVPCLLLSQVRIEYPPIRRLLLQKGIAFGAVLLIAIALYLPNQLFFNAFADNAANYRLKKMILPFNYLGSLGGFLREELESLQPAEPRATGDAAATNSPDAVAEYTRTPSASGKRTVLIFVLGESARARSLSLNGYPRETTPRLSRG
jgi:lipid A ethanolaminephosphotransferase